MEITDGDTLMAGDGGQDGQMVTYAVGEWKLGEGEQYWQIKEQSEWMIIRRLPYRYGHKETDVHLAEMIAKLVALRHRRPKQ